MDVEKVHKELIREAGPAVIKAQWVDRFVESPISFWCQVNAPSEAKDPINSFQQHLFDVGNQHQSAVTTKLYPGAVVKSFFTEVEGCKLNLELMAEGAAFIKDMPLMCRPAGLEGRADVLERVDDAPSDLGSYGYRVVEIKSARRIKKSHILQAAAYNRVLGYVLGHEPLEFHLVNRDQEVLSVRMEDVADELDLALERIRAVLAGEPVDPCFGAGSWPWASYVNGLAIARNDVSLLPGVKEAMRRSLLEVGFSTISEVAAASAEELAQTPGVGNKRANNFISSAQAITQDRPVRRAPTPEVRRGETEVFFDFEGTDPALNPEGLATVNYLIGVLWRSDGVSPVFKPFFAGSPDEEEHNLRMFLDWANSLPDPVFYHWHHYERTHLVKMAEYYGIAPASIEGVTDRMEDLSPLATGAFAFPCYGQGLKNIAKSLGFDWRQDDVDALASIMLYSSFVQSCGTDHQARQKIIDYNEDDCLATMHIFDWLLAQDE